MMAKIKKDQNETRRKYGETSRVFCESPTAAAARLEARARYRDERWRELVGETKEDQQKMLDELKMQKKEKKKQKKLAASKISGPPPSTSTPPPSRSRRSRSPTSRARRSTSPSHRRPIDKSPIDKSPIDKSVSPQPRASDLDTENDKQQDAVGECGTVPMLVVPPTPPAVTPLAASAPTASGGAKRASECPVTLPAPPLPPSPPLKVRAKPAPVPNTRALRLLLSILKHNPTDSVQEVGVLLMLHASSIEVAKATAAAGHSSSSGGDGNKRTTSALRIKEREEAAKLDRRTEEAEELLAIAALASAEKGYRDAWERVGPRGDSNGSAPPAAGVTKTKTKKKKTGPSNKTRFYHQLRQPAKVEDRLRAWAATRGREVAGLRELLGLSEAGKGKKKSTVLQPSPANARLVRDRAALISAENVDKALPEAGLVLDFISHAIGTAAAAESVTVRESTKADVPKDSEMRPSSSADDVGKPTFAAGSIQNTTAADEAGAATYTCNIEEDLANAAGAVAVSAAGGSSTVARDSMLSREGSTLCRSAAECPSLSYSSSATSEPLIWESSTSEESGHVGLVPGKSIPGAGASHPLFENDDNDYNDYNDYNERDGRGAAAEADDAHDPPFCVSSAASCGRGSVALDDSTATALAMAVTADEKEATFEAGPKTMVSSVPLTLSENVDREAHSSSSGTASVVIWESTTSENDSAYQRNSSEEPASPSSDVAAGAAALATTTEEEDEQEEGDPRDSRRDFTWPVDPLEVGRDPLGDLPLVSEDGERNAWDEILEEQLSKCRPIQRSPVALSSAEAAAAAAAAAAPSHVQHRSIGMGDNDNVKVNVNGGLAFTMERNGPVASAYGGNEDEQMSESKSNIEEEKEIKEVEEGAFVTPTPFIASSARPASGLPQKEEVHKGREGLYGDGQDVAPPRYHQSDLKEEAAPPACFEDDFDDTDAAAETDVVAQTDNRTTVSSFTLSSSRKFHRLEGEEAARRSVASSPRDSDGASATAVRVAGPPAAATWDDNMAGDEFRRHSPSSSSSHSLGRGVMNINRCDDRSSTPSSGSSVASGDAGAASVYPSTGRRAQRMEHGHDHDRLMRWENGGTNSPRRETAVEWPRATHYARLLNTACRSMRDSLQGEELGHSGGEVDEAVRAAETAVHTAAAAVADAVKLLDEYHRSERRSGGRIVARLEFPSPPTSPPVKPAANASQRCSWKGATGGNIFDNGNGINSGGGPNRYTLGRKSRSLPSSPNRVFRPLELGPAVGPSPQCGVLAGMLSRISTSDVGSPGDVHGEALHGSVEDGGSDWAVHNQVEGEGGEGKEKRQARQEIGSTVADSVPAGHVNIREFEVYWAEVVAETMSQVAEESAQRATATALAYERSGMDEGDVRAWQERGKGGGCRAEGARGEEPPGDPLVPLPQPLLVGKPACDATGGWLESKLAAAAARSTARIAATMTRRAAALKSALEPASPPAARLEATSGAASATPLVLG